MKSPASIVSMSFVLVACTSPPPLSAPVVPAALQPPAGQTLYLEALASGVQIYECVRNADATYGWAFRSPEASLTSRAGLALGTHYAGPTWESKDGSAVVGEVRAKDPGPDPAAIPWLLLAAKAHKGDGAFGATKSIQRVATQGGVAPTTPCAEANAQAIVRVPYTATYTFYR